MIDDYFKAKRMADRSIRRAVLEGRYPYLSDLDSKPGMSDTLSCIDLGIKEIPIQQIRGTKTKGRQGVFSYDFLPCAEKVVIRLRIAHQKDSGIEIVLIAGGVVTQLSAHVYGCLPMGMLPECGVKVRGGGKGGLNAVDSIKRTGYHRICIDEKKVPFHVLPHAGLKEAGTLHGRDGRVELSHQNLRKKGREGLGKGVSVEPAVGSGLVREKGHGRAGIMPGAAGCAHESLLQIHVLRAAHKDI